MTIHNMYIPIYQSDILKDHIISYKNGLLDFTVIMSACYNWLRGHNVGYNAFAELIKSQYGLAQQTVLNMVLGAFVPSKVFQDKIINFIDKFLKECCVHYRS